MTPHGLQVESEHAPRVATWRAAGLHAESGLLIHDARDRVPTPQAAHASFLIHPDHGIPVLRVANSSALAHIALRGAQPLTYQPWNHAPVLHFSAKANWGNGKSLRGGSPFLYPGADAESRDARNRIWELERIDHGDGHDMTRVVLSLTHGDYRARRIITVGKTLSLENLGNLTHSQGEHPYFEIGDLHKVSVHGLDSTLEAGLLDDFIARGTPDGAEKHFGGFRPTGATEQVFAMPVVEGHSPLREPNTHQVVVADDVLNREIRVEAQFLPQATGAITVWHPGLAHDLADLADPSKMLCVEPIQRLNKLVDRGSVNGQIEVPLLKTVISVVKGKGGRR